MKYIFGATTALLICSVTLNLALLSGSLVTEKQVASMMPVDYVTAMVELQR